MLCFKVMKGNWHCHPRSSFPFLMLFFQEPGETQEASTEIATKEIAQKYRGKGVKTKLEEREEAEQSKAKQGETNQETKKNKKMRSITEHALAVKQSHNFFLFGPLQKQYKVELDDFCTCKSPLKITSFLSVRILQLMIVITSMKNGTACQLLLKTLKDTFTQAEDMPCEYLEWMITSL